MSKTILLLLLCVATWSHAQNVGINTSNPQQDLSIGDNNSGLEQNSENVLSIVTGATNRIKMTKTGNVGINNETPVKKLDIDAINDFIKFRNLKEITTPNPYFLVYDKTNGDVSKVDLFIKAGQVLRVPLVTKNLPAGNYNVEFNTNGASIPAPDNLSSFPNYINTITEDNTTFPVSVSAYQINNIPAGTYKIILKFCGGFLNGNDNQRVNAGLLVSSDGTTWNDYSYSEGIISNWSNTANTDKTGYYTDVVKFTAPNNFIKFKLDVILNEFQMENAWNNIYRNVLIIERL